jgi:hypothetical protein
MNVVSYVGNSLPPRNVCLWAHMLIQMHKDSDLCNVIKNAYNGEKGLMYKGEVTSLIRKYRKDDWYFGVY